jgi:uncharacterized protein (DUF433 family)
MASDASTQTEFAHIVCTPGVLGGEPRIDGHRIRVRDIVVARDHGGYSPEEIAATVYPSLSLGEVYAALGFYEDHRNEIDGAAAAEDEAVERFQQEHPSLVVSLQPKKVEP